MDKDTIFQENIQLLLKATRSEQLFRFIIIQQNHIAVYYEVKEILAKKYPQRLILYINILLENYQTLTEKIFTHQGFVIIENFEALVNNPAFANGFNQRRDRLTQLPIQLICFLPEGKEYLRDCAEKIKDLWSVRDLILELNLLGEVSLSQIETMKLETFSFEETFLELNRLTERINELELNNFDPHLLTILEKQLNSLNDHFTRILSILISYQDKQSVLSKKIKLINKNYISKILESLDSDIIVLENLEHDIFTIAKKLLGILIKINNLNSELPNDK